MYVYSRERGVRKLKEGITLETYKEKYPSAVECFPPTLEELEEMDMDGIVETPCGCRVEPDGHCEHGNPSWFIIMGII